MSDAYNGKSGRMSTSSKMIDDADYTRELERGMNQVDLSRPEKSYDWMGPEYEKHIQGVRERYPMLTQLLMRPKARDSANLSTIDNTNKYARLADAYNAKYRYKPSDISVGFDSYTIGAPGQYEAVNKIETQDQKQMDQLRQAQADLRGYELDEESHFQRDYARRKMDEMGKLIDREYQQQWFRSDESKRRVAELFDSWKNMNEQEFLAVTNQIGIPKQKALDIMSKLQSGDYIGAAYLAQAHGITPMNIDQMYQYGVTAGIAQALANGQISNPTALAQQIGRLKGAQVIEEFAGIFNYAKSEASSDEIKQVANLASRVINKGVELGDKALGLADAAIFMTLLNLVLKEAMARGIQGTALVGGIMSGGLTSSIGAGGSTN